MAKRSKPRFKKQILSKDLLLLSERSVSKGEVRKGFQKIQVRVCAWNGGTPVLEKRILVLDLDGIYYPYKSAGFGLADFELLIENKEKIIEALKTLPDKVANETVERPSADS